ncbi:MAG: PIN domain-containing protein [Burkholderiales bacterium]|nr:PIN domain-containing protein [Burkholderiales bacterium]
MPLMRPPTEAILDTNAVLDWLLFQDAGALRLDQALTAGALRWVATAPMREELQVVLQRPQFEPWRHRIEHVLTSTDRLCHPVDAQPVPILHRLWCG